MMAIFVWTLNDIGLLVVLALLVLAFLVVLLQVLYVAIRDAVGRFWRKLGGGRHG